MVQVFIPSAGRGERLRAELGDLPKPLAAIGGFPLIERVLSLYPTGTRFIIALGYQASLIQEYLALASNYRSRNITFVFTESWKTNQQGLTQTLLAAEMALGDSPFIFHAVDTILSKVPESALGKTNKNLIYQARNPLKATYRRFDGTSWEVVDNGKLHSSQSEVYTGFAKINEVKEFWMFIKEQALLQPEAGETLGLRWSNSEVRVLENEGVKWFDAGNIEGLLKADKAFSHSHDIVLLKKNEAIYSIDQLMIKVHTDPEFIAKRVARSESLKPYTPKILGHGKNIFWYQRIEGQTLSRTKGWKTFSTFLHQLTIFWGYPLKNVTVELNEFYFQKSNRRIREMVMLHPTLALIDNINGLNVGDHQTLLDKIDWTWLCSSPFVGRVHGDLHPDNVIVTGDQIFHFVDWRQDFAGRVDSVGDVYYDLAKLLHGLRIDHGTVLAGKYELIHKTATRYRLRIRRPLKKIIWERIFWRFVHENNYSRKRIELLEALIYLNISPLHEGQYGEFLYLHGIRMLAESMKDG